MPPGAEAETMYDDESRPAAATCRSRRLAGAATFATVASVRTSRTTTAVPDRSTPTRWRGGGRPLAINVGAGSSPAGWVEPARSAAGGLATSSEVACRLMKSTPAAMASAMAAGTATGATQRRSMAGRFAGPEGSGRPARGLLGWGLSSMGDYACTPLLMLFLWFTASGRQMATRRPVRG